jgi:hypothetical protein
VAGVRFPVREEHFSLLYSVQTGCETHPASCPAGDISLGVKRQGCIAEQLLPSSVEVKKFWSYTSNPPYILGRYGVNM